MTIPELGAGVIALGWLLELGLAVWRCWRAPSAEKFRLVVQALAMGWAWPLGLAVMVRERWRRA